MENIVDLVPFTCLLHIYLVQFKGNKRELNKTHERETRFERNQRRIYDQRKENCKKKREMHERNVVFYSYFLLLFPFVHTACFPFHSITAVNKGKATGNKPPIDKLPH